MWYGHPPNSENAYNDFCEFLGVEEGPSSNGQCTRVCLSMAHMALSKNGGSSNKTGGIFTSLYQSFYESVMDMYITFWICLKLWYTHQLAILMWTLMINWSTRVFFRGTQFSDKPKLQVGRWLTVSDGWFHTTNQASAGLSEFLDLLLVVLTCFQVII